MENLWEIVDKENITVRYENLLCFPERLHGLYIYDHRIGPLIILGHHLEQNRRLHKCVLAEELGHYKTSPRTNLITTYTSANLKLIQSQDERKAVQWATDFLIPDVQLIEAFRAGCRTCFELAEYFDVTEWFMYRKLHMSYNRTSLRVRVI